MFTVFEEAIISLHGKPEKEIEQSASAASMLEGSWEPQSATFVRYCLVPWPSVESQMVIRV